MASSKQTLNKLLELMEDIEEKEFVSDEKTMLYCGKLYSRSDFKNMKRAIKQVQKTYQCGVNKSVRYLQKNKEYNRTLRMINYYKTKHNKTVRDFERLEKLQKTLEGIILERDQMRLENSKLKVIEREIAFEKRKFEAQDVKKEYDI